mmetsp:Transcript_40417/g.47287  ORF Transcript_40417/g.47287 Transcript_40417/m.47287 type:complete len:772 (+) Transcript_40417:174-2489(+)
MMSLSPTKVSSYPTNYYQISKRKKTEKADLDTKTSFQFDTRIPSSVFHYSILTYLDSNELLQFRVASVFCYNLVHGQKRRQPGSKSLDKNITAENAGSDSLWRQALSRDFYFLTASGSSTTTSIQSVSKVFMHGKEKTHPCDYEYLQSLRWWNPSVASALHSADERVKPTSTSCAASRARRGGLNHSVRDVGVDPRRIYVGSIFGYEASQSIMVCATPFDSWKHWRKASNIYYFLKVDNTFSNNQTSRDIAFLHHTKVISAEKKQFRHRRRLSEIKSRAGTLHGPYFLRAAHLWAKIEHWCKSNVSNGSNNATALSMVGKNLQESFLPGLSYFQSHLRTRTDEDNSDVFMSDDDIMRKGRCMDARNDAVEGRALMAAQALYSFYGGQNVVPFPPSETDHVSRLFCGLLGGYSAYNNVICTRLLSAPTSNTINNGRFVRHAEEDDPEDDEDYFDNDLWLDDSGRQRQGRWQSQTQRTMKCYIPLAASNNLDAKHFDLQVSTGKVRLQTAEGRRDAVSGGGGLDSVLVWLEEHARRLENGSVSVGPIVTSGPATLGITLFPTLKATHPSPQSLPSSMSSPPLPTAHLPIQPIVKKCNTITSRAVTRNVEVIASAVYTPELQDRGLAFIYSIRIRLLTPDDNDPKYLSPEARGYSTCQLHSRHWMITDDATGRTEHVRGEGVIGLFPLLREGGYRYDSGSSAQHLEPPGPERKTVFSYQSCTGPISGSFKGSLRFVVGNLREDEEHTGQVGRQQESFDVEVAPFVLNMNPKFLF